MSTEERQNIESESQALDMNKWQIIVSEWELSKESQKTYCKRLGININTFTYVRGKLLAKKRTKSTFVPIVLKDQEQQVSQKLELIIFENKQGLKLHVPSTLTLDQLDKIFRLCRWQHA